MNALASPERLQKNCRQVSARKGPKPFGIGAAWLRFAHQSELVRLAVLHVRIERKKRALAELRAERDTIGKRCEKRMQRERGRVQ